jgi:hypothetical protein
LNDREAPGGKDTGRELDTAYAGGGVDVGEINHSKEAVEHQVLPGCGGCQLMLTPAELVPSIADPV